MSLREWITADGFYAGQVAANERMRAQLAAVRASPGWWKLWRMALGAVIAAIGALFVLGGAGVALTLAGARESADRVIGVGGFAAMCVAYVGGVAMWWAQSRALKDAEARRPVPSGARA